MDAKKLNGIIADLTALGVTTYLDGGWGVDALLGEQTRDHKDVDLFIFKPDMQTAKNYFLSKGFVEKPEGDMWWHFFMENDDTQIDFMVFEPDELGGAYLGEAASGPYFPPEVWTGVGYVGDQKVNCVDAAYRVHSLTKAFGVVVRNGYQITEKDCRDLIALCRKFNLPIPVDYTDFMRDHQLTY